MEKAAIGDDEHVGAAFRCGKSKAMLIGMLLPFTFDVIFAVRFGNVRPTCAEVGRAEDIDAAEIKIWNSPKWCGSGNQEQIIPALGIRDVRAVLALHAAHGNADRRIEN